MNIFWAPRFFERVNLVPVLQSYEGCRPEKPLHCEEIHPLMGVGATPWRGGSHLGKAVQMTAGESQINPPDYPLTLMKRHYFYPREGIGAFNRIGSDSVASIKKVQSRGSPDMKIPALQGVPIPLYPFVVSTRIRFCYWGKNGGLTALVRHPAVTLSYT